MVRSDLMWAIDQSLRLNRGRPREAFGGVRLALFGDLHQLPPVVNDAEVAEHLELQFGGPFFFSLPALGEGAGTSLIELSEVFRQKDAALLDVLNKIREGDVDEDDLALLNSRVHPIRTLSEGEDYVILDAHQRGGRPHQHGLSQRPAGCSRGPTRRQRPASSTQTAQSTETALTLKAGAKVMMLRNDPDRRWVNGTIARVSRLEEDRVWIEVDGDEHEIEPVSWHKAAAGNAFDQAADKIVETVAGSFKQLPLRLAWALTIHKSQGLTLDKTYIDLGRGTFAHGQAYCGAGPAPPDA